jgi:DNA-binding LacI/PurR family transcriptional regulator
MTASRALRGDRCVSAARRAQVAQAAAALGYRLNPAASSLMSHIRRRRVATYRGKIAWLNPGRPPFAMADLPWRRPLYEGVRQCAEQSGYLLESVWLNDPSLRPDRLNAVLIARGIQGLVISNPHPHLDHIEWNRFACATTLPSPIAPPVHLASSDLMHGVRESFVHLRGHGYDRIGLMLHLIHDRESQGMVRAAHMFETADLPARARLPVLLLPHPADPPDRVAAFGNWVKRYQPEAVICCDEHVLGWARTLGIAVPGRLGLVHLNRHSYLKKWAGIDQREDQIGAAAVDLVVGQLVRGEFGIPPFQKEVLIKGQWVDGATVRPKP